MLCSFMDSLYRADAKIRRIASSGHEVWRTAATASDQQITRAIDKVYDVALDPAQWTERLRQIGEPRGTH